MNKLNLVLLHGWLFNSQIWSNMSKDFDIQHNIATPDLPGYDMNTTKSNETFNISNHLVNSVSRNVLIGWSFGGMLALKYTLNFKNVSKLILLNFNFPSKDDKLNDNAIDYLCEELTVSRDKAIKNFIFECCKGSKKYLKDYKKLTNESILSQLPTTEVLLSNLQEMKSLRKMISEPNHLKVDTLIINGRQDSLLSNTNSKDFNSSIKYEIINEMAHIPFLSHKKIVTEKIKSFLDE